jgi:hypothetical protein
MLRTTFLVTTALSAALLCAACEQKSNPETEAKDRQAAELAAQPAPNAAERTAAQTGNEVEQAVGPNAQITAGELAAGINGVDVPNPATTLTTAAVKTAGGEAVGEVRSVDVGPDGKAVAITVEVGGFLGVGERAVSIDAKKFTYLKDRNILVVALAKSDIEAMPPVVQH